VAGLVLVNPSVKADQRRLRAVPVLRHLVPSVAGIASDIAKEGAREVGYDRTPLHAVHSLTGLWREVRADLPRVTQPVLLLRSRVDHVVHPSNAAVVLGGISSTDVTEIELARSYHVATLDHDAELIFDASWAFVSRLTGAGAGARAGAGAGARTGTGTGTGAGTGTGSAHREEGPTGG
jgi:carboxylesterase